jgi:hypothetical protein
MGDILLNSKVIIYLLSEGITYLMLFIAFIVAVEGVIKWNYSSYSEEQYRLEKRAYLIVTITLFASIIKFSLLPYFVFVIDSLAPMVTGAMCGAGVIGTNGYGLILLLFKLLTIFMLTLWITINHYDIQAKNYPYFKMKSWLFILIFITFTIEIVLNILYFINIEPELPVSCCSTLFGGFEGNTPLPFGVNIETLLILFGTLFMIVSISLYFNYNTVSLPSSILFLYISYYSIVYFFGTYIYELPTHKCPFCMLQKDYYYIGYIIWGTLFGGVFLAIVGSIIRLMIGVKSPKMERIAFILLSLFVIITLSYVFKYYLINGVFL